MKSRFIIFNVMALLLFTVVRCTEPEMQPSNQQDLSSIEKSTGEDLNATQAKVIKQPVKGTINGIPFTAEFQISKFTKEGANTIKGGGKLFAVGTLKNIKGKNLPAAVSKLSTKQIKMRAIYKSTVRNDATASTAADPVQNVTCQILNLDLQPLHLDILGLVVDLNRVTLVIKAVTGASNLLGNLLCAVTQLFTGLGSLGAIIVLLMQILDLIGTIGG